MFNRGNRLKSLQQRPDNGPDRQRFAKTIAAKRDFGRATMILQLFDPLCTPVVNERGALPVFKTKPGMFECERVQKNHSWRLSAQLYTICCRRDERRQHELRYETIPQTRENVEKPCWTGRARTDAIEPFEGAMFESKFGTAHSQHRPIFATWKFTCRSASK